MCFQGAQAQQRQLPADSPKRKASGEAPAKAGFSSISAKPGAPQPPVPSKGQVAQAQKLQPPIPGKGPISQAQSLQAATAATSATARAFATAGASAATAAKPASQPPIPSSTQVRMRMRVYLFP